MAVRRVKQKVHVSSVVGSLAIATFVVSWMGGFPAAWVENGYSRPLFPIISHILSFGADAVSFSWFDVWILAGIFVLIYSIRSRKPGVLIFAVSASYLWFFWSWGINYHRPRLETKLLLRSDNITPAEVERFAQTAAAELNRLWPSVPQSQPTPEVAMLAAQRVRTVMGRIEGRDWVAADRIKHSVFAQGWFRISGIEGMFNPFGHEALVTSDLLPFEYPFVMTHELAHVRGIPNEGDANLVAVFATLSSNVPAFEYSGWFQLWLYLRNPERDKLLDPGPRHDLQAFFERVRSQQVAWANNLQSAVLDWHLKANDVGEGVASYSRFVGLAIASQDTWDRYR